MCRPVGGDILGYKRHDGYIVRFNKTTAEYVVGKPEKSFRTFMSPKYDEDNKCKDPERALEYYLKRKAKDMKKGKDNMKKTDEVETKAQTDKEDGSSLRDIEQGEPYLCPVCGKYTFEEFGNFDYCQVCGWQDDVIQYFNPDETRCCNRMSLNQAREAWKKGIKIV